MNFPEVRKQLDDTAFLVGWFRRRSALKVLAQSADPEAAAVLASAIDANSISAAAAEAVLSANLAPAWTDRLWEIWAQRRQPWLRKLLRQHGVAHSQAASKPGVLSRLEAGWDKLPTDEPTAASVAEYWRDADADVQSAARRYAGAIQSQKRPLWVAMMLELREFEVIGKDRTALESVFPFLKAERPTLRSAAKAYCEEFVAFDLIVLAGLMAEPAGSLELRRDVAMIVAAYLADANSTVAAQARAYADRVFETQPDYVLEFALRMGRIERARLGRATTLEALRLLHEADPGIAPSLRAWIQALPNDQKLNDLLVDDWIRSNDAFLFDLLREQRRMPSEGGKETLLRLLCHDIQGYRALGDEDGRLLAEALSMANEERRARIVEVIHESREAAEADQLRRASLRVQGMDSGLALKALLASGDEDRIVDAAREMTGGGLFELVHRWIETGRRPKDAKKRQAVERAVTALKPQPKLEIEPAPPLPNGLVDIFDSWSAQKPAEEELRRDLQAPDPILRARALHLGFGSGMVDAAALSAKARSEDWPERFVAALHGLLPNASQDHVHWVAACAGEDQGTHQMPVACGPEEFERAESRLAGLRANKSPLAQRVLAELEALQAFRALEKTTITVTDDDSATQKGALEAKGDVSETELAAAFGGGTQKPTQRKP